MNKLVVYYSLGGNTKAVAESIVREIEADTLELKLKSDIDPKGLMKYYWGGKQVYMKEKPELLPFDKDPSRYDVVFIGTPVWAFTYVPALSSFFSSVNLKAKKIALFCTHGGVKLNTLEKMEQALPGNTIIGKKDFPILAKAFLGRASTNAKEWAKKVIASI